MRKFLLSVLLAILGSGEAFPQTSTLFDDSRLSSVYITIPPDSLQRIYDSVLSDHYFMARFIFDDNSHRDTLENIGFRLRGNTSRYSEKKSFKISFNEYVSGRKYQGVKKINLNGEHNDPTMIREKLFYDIWKRCGMVERRTSFVRVFINNTYYGLYTNLEEMEKEWIALHYPATGGNLFKCTYPADLVYHGVVEQTYKDLENETATGGRVYELQTNKSQDDYARLVQMITILNQPVGGTFPQDIAAILDVDHFLKALAIDVATGNWDDYGYNKNNYYLYENPASGKYDFITYDPDNTFGVDWFGIDWGVRDCRNWINKKISLPMAQKLLATPEYFEKYKRYLDTIAKTIIDTAVIFPRIDSLKQLIQQAAIEDTYRTLDYGYSVADFNNSFTMAMDDHTPYGLKPFFTTRRQKILEQLHPAGIYANEHAGKGISVFPNPAGATLSFTGEDPSNPPVFAEISDLCGKLIMTFELKESPGPLAIGSLKPGIYLLQVRTTSSAFQTKFIKKQP